MPVEEARGVIPSFTIRYWAQGHPLLEFQFILMHSHIHAQASTLYSFVNYKRQPLPMIYMPIPIGMTDPKELVDPVSHEDHDQDAEASCQAGDPPRGWGADRPLLRLSVLDHT